MTDAAATVTDRPCEDCGEVVVAGLEPIDPTLSDRYEVATGVTVVGSDHVDILVQQVEWCTNLDCPSNHLPPGLHRVGVNRYVCNVCGDVLTGPIGTILAHRRTH